MEVWKEIEGYEGAYEISNKGSVKNIRTGKCLRLGYSNTSNYPCVVLSLNGHKKCYAVHRLVAKAFVPNPNNLPEINHINENREDNRAENLEWCSRLYNIRYGTGIRRRAENVRNDPRRSTQVIQRDMDGKEIRIYPSFHEMHRQTGYDRHAVKRAIDGKIKHAYGYKWSH